jgi:magnesium-transporting ATPase (P-type)
MKKAEKIRIFLSVSGLIMVFLGLFFGLVIKLPFSPIPLILSGLITTVLGLTYYPTAKDERQKRGLRQYFERYKNPILDKSEGKRVFQIGAVCIFSGFGLGLLTIYLITSPQGQALINRGDISLSIFLVIAVLLFLSGFILFWLGFVWTRIDMYKQHKKNEGN